MATFDEIAKRPFISSMQDGLTSLVLGLQWMLTGLVLLFAFSLHVKGGPLPLMFPLLWLLIILVSQWSLRKLKQQFSSSRQGYVAFQQPRWLLAVIVVTIISLPGLALLLVDRYPNYLPGWTGIAIAGAILLAFASLIMWFQYRLQDGLWLTLVNVAGGAWIYHLKTGICGLLWLLVANGGALALIGALRFRVFLKADRDREEGADA